MTDYIKRDDAPKWLQSIRSDCGRHQDMWHYAEALDQIIELLSTDVAQIRHGRWEKNDYLFLDTLYRCSVCGEEFYLENGTPQENQYYYCPNCGARMDGDGDEID